MEILLNTIVFLAGLAVLVIGSDWLIQACVKVSFIFKLSPLFIGLVLVALGTSTPEAGVGVISALKNIEGIALGNILGSNVANIALILGICSLIIPLSVEKRLFKKEIPFMVLAVALLYLLSFDQLISRLDGAILFLFFIVFCFVSFKAEKGIPANELSDFKLRAPFSKMNSKLGVFVFILLSFGVIFWGADLMVKGGSNLAYIFGVRPWVVGITIFAVGTSLPELAASLTASFKKVPSISVGNIIGSNIFNVAFILGAVALIRPIKLSPAILSFEFPVVLVFSLFLFPPVFSRYRINRIQGFLMICAYCVFIIFIIRRV